MEISTPRLSGIIAASALSGALILETCHSVAIQRTEEAQARKLTETTHDQIVTSGYSDGFTVTDTVTTAERYGVSTESGAAKITLDLGDCVLKGVDVVLVRGDGDEEYVSDIVSYNVDAHGTAGTSDSLTFASRGDLYSALTPRDETRVDENTVCAYVVEGQQQSAVVLPSPVN